MLVRRHLAIVLEHGQRSEAEIIVELVQGSAHDAVDLTPRSALSQRGLETPSEEARILMVELLKMKQQVRVEIVVRRNELIEHNVDHAASLGDVGERR